MKKQLLILSFALCATFGYSQTATNIFPASGNTGIGTVTPTSKLDVIANPSIFNPQKCAYFGGSRTVHLTQDLSNSN